MESPIRSLLPCALLASLAPAARAEALIGTIGGSEVGFEGLVQADYNHFDADSYDLDGDGVNDAVDYAGGDLDGEDGNWDMRRAELVLEGKGPGKLEWVLGFDANDDRFLDVNLKYKLGGRAGQFLQAGQFKQPGATLEELSSTRNNDFISKSSIANTFGTARRLGVQYGVGGAGWGAAASYFGRELSRNREHGGGFGLRGYFAPIDGDGNVLHVGASYTDKDTDGDTLRLRARPMADLAGTRFVDTGSSGLLGSDRSRVVGLETLWVSGPFKLQAEYMRTRVERLQGLDDFSGDGFYASGLWNLTGETWGYKSGVPTTALPDDPARGMWQWGLRYDTIDLTDGDVVGGRMHSWTAGLNWYWRSNFRVSLNYVAVEQDKGGIEDDPDIAEARLQIHW